MKYSGSHPEQKHTRQKLDLSVIAMDSNRQNRTRPFSSNSFRNNMAQNGALITVATTRKSPPCTLVVDETEAKKSTQENKRLSNSAVRDVKKPNETDAVGQHSSSPAGTTSPRNSATSRNSEHRNTSTDKRTSSQSRPVTYKKCSTSTISATAHGNPDTKVTKERLLSKNSSDSTDSFLLSSSDDVKSSQGGMKGKRNIHKEKKLSANNESSESDNGNLQSTQRCSETITPEALALRQAWIQFETHVKTIDDSTDWVLRIPKKTFSSSHVFQSVMDDMYGKSRSLTKRKPRAGDVVTYATQFIGRVKVRRALKSSQGVDEIEDENETENRPSKETIDNARKGWRSLRQHIQKMAAEKRMSKSKMSWDMLRYTLRGLSNMERTRYDLYQRYGLIPMVRSDGTIVQENTMLSERARSAMANKLNYPVTTNSPDVTKKRSRNYKSVDLTRSATP